MTGLCQMIPRESLTLEIPGWFSDLGKLMGKLRAIEWMAAAAHLREEGPLTRPGASGVFSSPQSSLVVQ